MTLTEFLLARIAEDEAVARSFAAHAAPDASGGKLLRPPVEPVGPAYPIGALLVGVERVLAECEAKRRIVDIHRRGTCSTGPADWCEGCGGEYGEGDPWPCTTLRAGASVYRDHPDYDPAWG